jgi:hypothetical protein
MQEVAVEPATMEAAKDVGRVTTTESLINVAAFTDGFETTSGGMYHRRLMG